MGIQQIQPANLVTNLQSYRQNPTPISWSRDSRSTNLENRKMTTFHLLLQRRPRPLSIGAVLLPQRITLLENFLPNLKSLKHQQKCLLLDYLKRTYSPLWSPSKVKRLKRNLIKSLTRANWILCSAKNPQS